MLCFFRGDGVEGSALAACKTLASHGQALHFAPASLASSAAAHHACAAAFEPERVCPGDQPTNVSDTIFKERVVVFDEAMGARVVVAGDINKVRGRGGF